MRDIQAVASPLNLTVGDRRGMAIAVDLTVNDDQAIKVSNFFLCRKGINAFPEFAEAFGFDMSKMVQGLAPEEYQFQVGLYLSHGGNLHFGNERSEFTLPPKKTIKFVLPLAPFVAHYFAPAADEDVFFLAKSMSEGNEIIAATGCLALIREASAGPIPEPPMEVKIELRVPFSELPADHFDKVGTLNPKPVKPMPNT